jgi:hypothetical protein
MDLHRAITASGVTQRQLATITGGFARQTLATMLHSEFALSRLNVDRLTRIGAGRPRAGSSLRGGAMSTESAKTVNGLPLEQWVDRFTDSTQSFGRSLESGQVTSHDG